MEKVGLAPLLGGAPKVRQRLEEGREQHLWGYALVRAAADWRRVGLGPRDKDADPGSCIDPQRRHRLG